MNPGSYEHETCSKRQLIPYSFRAYQYLKIEVWTKVAPFLKAAHIWQLHCMFPSTINSAPTARNDKLDSSMISIHKRYLSIPTFLGCCNCTVGRRSVFRYYFLRLVLLSIVVIRNVSTSLLRQKIGRSIYLSVSHSYTVSFFHSAFMYVKHMIGSEWC